jgi:GT2 family glycosyltransferase
MVSERSNDYIVTVGITTRNRPQLLRQALESVFRQTFRPLEVLVVDDASEPPLEPVPTPPDISLRWWRYETNQGLVAARHDLMARSQGRYFVSLDDDAYFTTPEDLSVASDFLETHPQVAVLSFRTIKPQDLPRITSRENLPSPGPCFSFRGGAHMMRLSVISKTGNYRGFFFHVGEETDLSYRIWDAGYQVAYFPQVQLVHDQPEEIRESKYILMWAYFEGRNGFNTIWLSHPWLWQLFSIPNFFINALIKYWRKHLLVPFFKGCLQAFREFPLVVKLRRPVSYRTIFALLRLRIKLGTDQWK